MRTILLVSSILLGNAVAQDPVPTPQVGLQTAPAGVQHWIQRLGSDSYRDRLEAETKLRELGGKAKKQLQAAAKDGDDSEVQWRAKRLLRQIEKARLQGEKAGGQKPSGLVERRNARERGQDPVIDRSSRGGRIDRGPARGLGLRELGGIEDMRGEFDRLFRRMEEMHGLDVPRHRFFDDTFFNDLKSQMDSGSRGNSTSVQVGPDGVHVEVTKTGKDGKPETEVYDAPDMETFHKNHPGVLNQSRSDIGLRSFGGDIRDLLDEMRVDVGMPQRGFDIELLQPRVVPFDQGFRRDGARAKSAPDVLDVAVPPTGRRLGIQIKPIPDALRVYLEMAPGMGLMVDVVQEGTLAEAMKLRSGDIVTKINGSQIGSPADVQKALGAIKKGADVNLEFLRRGERREAATKKRFDAPADVVTPGTKKRVRERIR